MLDFLRNFICLLLENFIPFPDTLEEMPMILQTPTDMNVSVGQDAVFDCKVSPKHQLSIQWIKHLDPLSSHFDLSNKSDENIQVS